MGSYQETVRTGFETRNETMEVQHIDRDELMRLRRLGVAGMPGEGSALDTARKRSAEDLYNDWKESTLSGLDEGLGAIEEHAVKIEEMISAAAFEETDEKSLEDILARLTKDIRTRSGELPHPFVLLHPLIGDRELLQKYLANPAFGDHPKRQAALQSMLALCDERLTLMKVKPEVVRAAEDDLSKQHPDRAMNRLWHGGRIIVTAVAALYALIGGVAALLSGGSKKPAAIAAIIALGAAAGPEFLKGTSAGEKNLNTIAFLGNPSFRHFIDAHGVRGDQGAAIVESIYDNQKDIKAFLQKHRKSTATPEDCEELLDTLALPSEARATVERLLATPKEFMLLQNFLSSVPAGDARENLLTFIRESKDQKALNDAAHEITKKLEASARDS